MTDFDSMKTTVIQQIEERIKAMGRGTIFFNTDFADLGTSDVIRQSLVRLLSKGEVIRVARGIYCYPRHKSKVLGGGIVIPSTDEIAHALAKRYHCRIAPTSDYAMNALGLSTQVPANVVYYTDGPTRRIVLDKGQSLTLLHTSSMKHFSYQSEMMQLIVLAMGEIGEGKQTEEQSSVIREALGKVSKADYENDIKLANTWVRNVLVKDYQRV